MDFPMNRVFPGIRNLPVRSKENGEKMPHNREKEEKKCEISGCKKPAVRSLSTKKAMDSGVLNIDSDGKERRHRESRGRTHVCKDHYRDFKKATKKKREIERLGW